MSGARYLGLISGTSADAIDLCLADLPDPGDLAATPPVVAAGEAPLDPALRTRVHRLADPARPADLDEVMALDVDLGEAFAAAAADFLGRHGVAPGELAGVGSHGQTVRHRPARGDGAIGSSLQLGSPAVIAARLGVPVYADFRRGDMALGGEGAPLAPLLDRLLLTDGVRRTTALNLGGIANLTVVPPRGSGAAVVAQDSGPASCWLDAACRLAGVPEGFDRGGARASRGRVDPELLAALSTHPYLALPAPKSTGLEEFTPGQARAILAGRRLEDALATLVEFTAATVAAAARDLEAGTGAGAGAGAGAGPPRRVVSGGGAKNGFLMARIEARLGGPGFEPFAAVTGVPGDAKEALLVAVLAARRRLGLPGNLPAATGASGPTPLGAEWLPPGARLPPGRGPGLP